VGRGGGQAEHQGNRPYFRKVFHGFYPLVAVMREGLDKPSTARQKITLRGI
jgi:hypothetical protein